MPKSPKNTIAQLKAKEFELHRLFQSNTEIAPQTLIEYLNKFCDSEYNVSPGIAASINNYFITYYNGANDLATAQEMVGIFDNIIKIGVTPTAELYQKLETLMLANHSDITSDDITNILWIGAKSGNVYSTNLITFLNKNLLKKYSPEDYYEKVNVLWSLAINKFMGLGSCQNSIINKISNSITQTEIDNNSYGNNNGVYLTHKLLIADFILGHKKRISDNLKFDDDTHTSYFQEYMLDKLFPKGNKYRDSLQKEYFIKELGKSVDGIIFKTPNSLKDAIIIEVDGPHHYTNGPCGQGTLRPKDKFIRKLLEERFECKVVTISCYDTENNNWDNAARILIENYLEPEGRDKTAEYKTETGHTEADAKATTELIIEPLRNEQKMQEEETFTIQEQLYRYASLARYIGDIPAGAEDILYDIKGNQEILNEALLIAYRNGNEKEKQVLLDWGAQINYIYNAEVESETVETKLLEAVTENNYPLVKYIVENRNISNEALDNSLYLALQKHDTPMTLLLHEHGASFLDFDSTENPLQLLMQNNNKEAIVFAFSIFKSITLDSNKIVSFSNKRFPEEIISVLKFINLLLSDRNHDIHKIIPSTVTEQLSTYQNFYQAAKDFYTTNYQDTLNKFISINQEFQYGVACNKRFLLAFKHFKELRQILNDERFIESFQDSRQFELILTPMLDFGLDKFNFTTESIAKIITKFNDISLDLLITYANPNFNFKSVHEIVCMLAERNDTRSALFLLENLDIYKVDCAKLLLEIADIDISKNSCNNIFMIYTLIRVFSGKDYSNKFADYIELDLLRTHKILTASYKKVKKLLGDFNKSFSKEDLHLSIEHKDIEAIKSAIDNDSIAHSLFIEHLCSVGNIVTTSEFTIDIKTKETIKAKARNKILDSNSTRINIIKDSIKTSDLLSKEKAKEIYINAFKEAVQGDFYEGAKLISSKFDSYLEFLGTLHQLYSQGDSINVRGMLHHCDFKFKKVDLLMQVYNQKGFDQSSVELTKFILELGYTVKDEINDWVDTKTTKLCDNNYLKEATKFVHQYHDHPEVETLGAAAENPSGDLT